MTLSEIIQLSVQKMNNEIYCKEVIFPYGKTGMIQKAIEISITNTIKELYPQYEFYHPDDNSSLPDVWSDAIGRGFEIKTTLGYIPPKGKTPSVRWVNGNIQEKTNIDNFLFIKFSIIDNILIIDNAWFGRLSYEQWHPDGKLMYITKNTVNSLCRKII